MFSLVHGLGNLGGYSLSDVRRDIESSLLVESGTIVLVFSVSLSLE